MLQQTNIEIIDQLIDLLKDIDTLVYQASLQTLHDCSVGQHVRHVTEFYLCALKGYENRMIDYDARERNIMIEIDQDFTIEILENVKCQLRNLNTDRNLMLRSKFGSNESFDIPSSFFRELTYLIEHTIHHLAIIKIGLNEVYPEIEIPKSFGVAYSTLRYRVAH